MPLESQEDYERLGEHLVQIEPALAAFAGEHGYDVYPRLSGGRYPNRRITHIGTLRRSILISMDLAPNGERYDRFFPEIPYSVGGGTWIDDESTLVRWHGPWLHIEGIPFASLVGTLQHHLRHFHSYLCEVTEEYVRTCNRTSRLEASP